MYDRQGIDLQVRDVVLFGYGIPNSTIRMGYVRRIGTRTLTVWSERETRLWTGPSDCVQKISTEEAMLWKLENI